MVRGNYDSEIYEAGKDYLDIIGIALTNFHPKYGYYLTLPFSGGKLEQPYILSKIWDIILSVIREYINEKNK